MRVAACPLASLYDRVGIGAAALATAADCKLKSAVKVSGLGPKVHAHIMIWFGAVKQWQPQRVERAPLSRFLFTSAGPCDLFKKVTVRDVEAFFSDMSGADQAEGPGIEPHGVFVLGTTMGTNMSEHIGIPHKSEFFYVGTWAHATTTASQPARAGRSPCPTSTRATSTGARRTFFS